LEAIILSVKKVFDKRLGVEISQLGFGAMRLPTLESGKIDWEEAAKLIDRAYEAGVNYFDTAYPYHDRESQPFLGETLKKYPRESYLLATKLPIWLVNSAQDVHDLFQDQLKDCRMDYFDFYMVHALDAERYESLVKYGIYEYLLELKKAGIIKFLGFSYHGDYDTFVKLLENYKWDFVKIQINYVDDVMLEAGKLHDALCKHDVPAVFMEPVRGGFLAKPPQTALDEMQNFDGEKLTPAAWALRWCRNKPNVITTVSGMSTMEQVEENIRIFSSAYPERLTEAESAMIERVRDIMLAIKTIPCTLCAYCMDCPMGVNIPSIFNEYNQYKLFPNEFGAGVHYGKLARENADASHCTKCGICSPMCPQSIDIPERLAEVHEEFEPLRQKFS